NCDGSLVDCDQPDFIPFDPEQGINQHPETLGVVYSSANCGFYLFCPKPELALHLELQRNNSVNSVLQIMHDTRGIRFFESDYLECCQVDHREEDPDKTTLTRANSCYSAADADFPAGPNA